MKLIRLIGPVLTICLFHKNLKFNLMTFRQTGESYFTGFEDALVRRVDDWMTRTSEGIAAMVNAEEMFTEQAKQAPKSGE